MTAAAGRAPAASFGAKDAAMILATGALTAPLRRRRWPSRILARLAAALATALTSPFADGVFAIVAGAVIGFVWGLFLWGGR